MARYARIVVDRAGIVPPIEVTNDDPARALGAQFPEFVDKMEASSGIRTRWLRARGLGDLRRRAAGGASRRSSGPG